MLKKLCFVLVFVVCVSVFSVNVAAGKTEDFETYDVEFEAIVPDNLVVALEIQLTRKSDNLELSYFLYNSNDYSDVFKVYPGEYTVTVIAGETEFEKFTFIYDEDLSVAPSTTAPYFLIIVDNYFDDSGEEDYTEDVDSDIVGPDKEDDDPSLDNEFSGDDADKHPSDNDSSKKEPNNETPTREISNLSLVFSFLFFLSLLIGIGFALWIYKKS